MQRGGAIVKVLIGLTLVVGLLAAAGIGLAVYMARHIAVKERGNNVRVETPFGSLRVARNAHVDARQFGIPLYPGAARVEDHRKLASVEFDLGDDGRNAFTVMAAEYTTTDSADRVAAFYREKFPSCVFKQKAGREWEIYLNEQGFKRIVSIRETQGRTHIGLASIGEPAAN